MGPGSKLEGMVGTQQSSTRRSGPHPSVTKRTPSRNDDFFDEAQLRQLREYVAPLRRNRRILLVLTTLVDLWLVFGLDIGPRIDSWFSGQGWVLRLMAIALIGSLPTLLVGLPFSYWTDLVYEKRSGMSTMTIPRWIKDQFLELMLGSLVIAGMVVPLYAAIHAFGSAWWIVGGAFIVAFMAVMAFVLPVLILPRFNKFTPLEPGPVRRRIEELAELQGVTIQGVYLMDASKRTTRPNAYVAGFGKTKRVVINDTIADFPLEELSQVIAHELGHYRRNHVVKGFPMTALQMPLALLATELVIGNDLVLGWAGVQDLGDPASFPLFGTFFFSIAFSVFGLPGRWQSRKYEREADLEALELIGDPTSFVAVWPRMVLAAKPDLEPTPWRKLQSTHPEIAERMQFGLDWAGLNGIAATRPAPQAVPEATAAR